MSEFRELIISLPSWVFSAVAGAMGAAIGVWISSLFGRNMATGSPGKGRALIIGICTALAIQGSIHGTPELKRRVVLEEVMSGVKSNRLLSVLIREHPEIEERLKTEMRPILNDVRDKDGMQAFAKAQTVSARIVGDYLPQYYETASDEALFRMLKHEAETMIAFKDRPALCVSYHLGAPQFEKGDVSDDYVEMEIDIKADLIESAVLNRNALKSAASIETILATLSAAYAKNNFPVEDIYQLGEVATLPPQEGCRIATEFIVAIVSLGERDSSYTFKSLLALDQ